MSQAKFAYNSTLNCSIGKIPFEVVYTKALNHVPNLLKLPPSINSFADTLVERIYTTLDSVGTNLEASNVTYEAYANIHRRLKCFSKGNLVMVHLQKE